MKTIKGKNVISVSIHPDNTEGALLHAFFDPYTQNITAQYTGRVCSIIPGFNIYNPPFLFFRPKKTPKDYNINYFFTQTDSASVTTAFFIQSQYFGDQFPRVYFCYNCQAPQLYFSPEKVIKYNQKTDVKNGDIFTCDNPPCQKQLQFLGMVTVREIV